MNWGGVKVGRIVKTLMVIGLLSFLAVPYSLAQNDYWDGPANITNDIHREGSVGIGVTAPSSILHIDGVFRFNHQEDFAVDIGRDRFIHNNSILTNTFVGRRSGISNDQEFNSFFGEESGLHNTDGWSNTFLGYRSGFNNEEGSNNTFVGNESGHTNQAEHNTAVGSFSLRTNEWGNNNIAMGYNALVNMNEGDLNTVIGTQAASNVTTNQFEEMVVIGANAGQDIVDQSVESVVIGSRAMQNANGANRSVAIGQRVADNVLSLEDEVYIGYEAGINNINSGGRQTLVGFRSGIDLTEGVYNTFIGSESGYGFDEQNENVVVGNVAGAASGSDPDDFNTLIGARSIISAASSGNFIRGSSAIGFNSEVCEQYTMVLGDHNPGPNTARTTVVIGGCEPDHATPGNGDFEVISPSLGVGEIYADVYNTPSDKRLKTNIEQIASPIKTINGINGYLYSYKNDIDKLRSGVIAQELAEHFPYAVKEANSGYYVVNYDAIIPLLLQGIKEQQDTISSLKAELNDLKQEVEEIKQELGISKPSVPGNSTQNGDLTGSLKQNKPNPFSEETVVSYSVEGDFDIGTISILDFNGQQIKNFRVQEPIGEVRFNGSGYPAGIYFYGLFVDGELLDIKKMIIAR